MAASKTPFVAENVVTEKVETILANVTPAAVWERPWAAGGYTNAITGNAYTGINPILLMFSSVFGSFSSPLWMTYNQAREFATVRDIGFTNKGQAGTTLFRYIIQPNKLDEAGEIIKKGYSRTITFSVFNLDQFRFFTKVYTGETDEDGNAVYTEGETLNNSELFPRANVRTQFENMGAIETLFGAFVNGPRIQYGGDRACYIPTLDVLNMPERGMFVNDARFWGVTAHEYVHATGHASRLNRAIMNAKGSKEYGYEELIAEIGSLYILLACGVEISQEHAEQSMNYINGWAKQADNKNDWFMKAARDAKKAAEYILQFRTETDELDEQEEAYA